RREMLEDRTLGDAVAAPGASQAKNVHWPHKSGEQIALGRRQLHVVENLVPALLLTFVGVPHQEFCVGKPRAEFVEEVQARLPHFFGTTTVIFGDTAGAWPVTPPTTSTSALSAACAFAAAVTSISVASWPSGIVALPAVTLAGRFRTSSAIAPV